MGQFADENGNAPKASDMATEVWRTKVVSGIENNPASDLFFRRDGLEMLNTYRPDLLPTLPENYSQDDLDAISAVECHAEMLIPDSKVRTIFLDFLAYCVQHPGVKIRWAPLIYGMEGDGIFNAEQGFAERAGHRLEAHVTRLVAVDVVELFEVIDVADDNAQWRVISQAALPFNGKRVFEMPAIGDAGEAV